MTAASPTTSSDLPVASPTSTPVPPSYAPWYCQVRRPDTENFVQQLSGLTVGDRFHMKCEAQEVIQGLSSSLQARLNLQNQEIGEIYIGSTPTTPNKANQEKPINALILQPLRPISLKEEQFVIETSFYRAGKYTDGGGALFVRDGQSIPLRGFSVEVKSVLQNQMQTPYVQYGVATGDMLWSGLWGVVTIICIVFAVLALWVRQFFRKKNEFASVDSLRTARTPFDEFILQVQRQRRRLGAHTADWFLGVFTSFLKYLACELCFPAHKWPSHRISKYIRHRYFLLYQKWGKDLNRLLRECQLAQSKSSQLRAEEITQLVQSMEHMANKIYTFQKTQVVPYNRATQYNKSEKLA